MSFVFRLPIERAKRQRRLSWLAISDTLLILYLYLPVRTPTPPGGRIANVLLPVPVEGIRLVGAAFFVPVCTVLFGKTLIWVGADAGADLIPCRFDWIDAIEISFSSRSTPFPRFIKLAGVIGMTPFD
jgi:hypothetical protein